MSEWISVKDKMPKNAKHCLASFVTNYDRSRRLIKAFYAEKHSIESDNNEDDYDEYCEDKDSYFLIEGWYEVIENWADYSYIHVSEGIVTHWQDLLKHPEGKENE